MASPGAEQVEQVKAEPLLRLHNVSKSYAGARVLESTTLNVPSRKTLVLIGPSGCGKSTLLRIMVGLVLPDEGTVTFAGTAVTAATVRMLRRRIGYVVQEGGLFPHLTAVDNVTLMARHLEWPAARIRSRIDELATLARLPGDLLARFPVQLSGGQRQRVGLMRALMLDPELLLLDEPLGAIDPMVRAELQDDLAQVFRALGKSVVMVTHDLAEAAFFAHEIVLMRSGRILQRDSIHGLTKSPADPFVTQFINAQRRPQTLPGQDAQ